MDFLSIILAAIGWGREDAAKKADRKMDAFRLNAEVAGECIRAMTLLDHGTASLMRRLQALYPGEPEIYQSCTDTLSTMRSQCQQIYDMAENNKASIENSGRWVDWDKAVRMTYQWRVTASAFVPQAEAILRQYEGIVAQQEQPQLNDAPQTPPRSFPSQRDRGWDAPPL